MRRFDHGVRFMEMLRANGREEMNRALVETVKRERPADDHRAIHRPVEPEAVDEISRYTTTVGIFSTMLGVLDTRASGWSLLRYYDSNPNGVARFREAASRMPSTCLLPAITRLPQDGPSESLRCHFVGQYHPYRPVRSAVA